MQLPAALWTCVIFSLCLADGRWFPSVNIPHIDKLVHFMMFLCFSLVCYRMPTSCIIIFGLALAILTEILQGVLPIHRSFDLRDMLVDVIGLIIGISILYLWRVL